MIIEPSKKFVVGDLPPSPTTSNPISNNSNTHKKPIRHHYKRRSSGRVHVTKLAPMAKAHAQQQSATEGEDNDNNIDDEDDNFEDVLDQQKQQPQQHAPRKPMKRTHSNKSIHRLSTIDPHRKVNLSGFIMTSKSTTAAASSSSQKAPHQSSPMTPTDQQFQQRQQNPSTMTEESVPNDSVAASSTTTTTAPLMEHSTRRTKPMMASPSFQVSHQATAAPIANTLNATATTLVTPDKAALANFTTPNDSSSENKAASKTKHLYSRFVHQMGPLTTTTSSDDESYHRQQRHEMTVNNHTVHSNHVEDDVEKEYRYIQTYKDPMVESLTRCMKQRRNTSVNSRPSSSSTQLQLQRLAQRGAQQRTFSSSILPTMSTLASSSSSSLAAAESISHTSSSPPPPPHMEHRQMARRRHHRLQAAHASSTNHYHHHHYSSTSTSSEINKQPVSRWSAGALLDRVFYSAS